MAAPAATESAAAPTHAPPSQQLSADVAAASPPSVFTSATSATGAASNAAATIAAADGDLCLRSLLSRQLLVWGPEQQEVLPSARVLLLGAGAAAVEAAKCLLQSGIGCILISDPEAPSHTERAANFAVAAHAEEQAAAAASAATSPYYAKGTRQQQLTRAGIACAALRRVAAPYARVAEVSLQQQHGESVAAWRARVLRFLQQVDVVLLCDRPLHQKIFFGDLVRELQQQQQQRVARPLIVTVCTAGLSGRIAVDFGEFEYHKSQEEAALSALLEKHAQSQQKRQQQQQQKMELLTFPPLRDVLSLSSAHQQPQQQQAAPADEQQQLLNAAFEALDEAEAEGRGLPAAAAPGVGGAAAAHLKDIDPAVAAAAAGSLRSWKSSRVDSAGRVASRAASIWRSRYGPSAAAAAAAASASSTAAAAQLFAEPSRVAAAAEEAAAAAIAKGAAEAARLGALMTEGAKGHLAPIAAAMGRQQQILLR